MRIHNIDNTILCDLRILLLLGKVPVYRWEDGPEDREEDEGRGGGGAVGGAVGGAGGGGTVMQTLDRRISASSDQLDTLRHGGANMINSFFTPMDYVFNPILHTVWLDNHGLTLKSNTAKHY
jgi:hypothetical protein